MRSIRSPYWLCYAASEDGRTKWLPPRVVYPCVDPYSSADCGWLNCRILRDELALGEQYSVFVGA